MLFPCLALLSTLYYVAVGLLHKSYHTVSLYVVYLTHTWLINLRMVCTEKQHLPPSLPLSLSGRVEEAIREYQYSLSLDPTQTTAMNNLARAYRSRGENSNAEHWLLQ